MTVGANYAFFSVLRRGLAALIPQGPAGEAEGAVRLPRPPARPAPGKPAAPPEPTGTVAGAVYREIPTESIQANPKQPRQVFDEDALNELITSIKEVGLLQPVVVRQIGVDRF